MRPRPLCGFCHTFLHIEYILIVIALATILFTGFFKHRAVLSFDALDGEFMSLQEAAGREGANGRYKYPRIFSALEASFFPYTYFDQSLALKVAALRTIAPDALPVALIHLQNDIHHRQRVLLFSYDSLLYFSAILTVIALFVIVAKRLAQKAELEQTRLLNDEQIKLSRNLHDGVAQDLTAIKAYLQQGDSEKSAFYADRALSEVRYLIDSSRITLSDGLESIVRDMLAIFGQNYGISTDFVAASLLVQRLGSTYQTEIVRIMQEALSNIARHAKASQVQVKFADVGDDLHIVIRDNGIGFDQEAQADGESSHENRRHWGITNIRERVCAMHGTVQFIHDGGTTVAITLTHPVS